jgi:hypothetical protein
MGSNYLPEALLTSSVGAAISNTNALDFIPAPGSYVGLLLHEISVANVHESANTVLDILAGSDQKFGVPAPVSGPQVFKFDPPLDFPANTKLAVKAKAAATIWASVRYSKQSKR